MPISDAIDGRRQRSPTIVAVTTDGDMSSNPIPASGWVRRRGTVRRAIAGAVSVASAVLTALWGRFHATTEPEDRRRARGASPPSTPSGGGGETRNTILGGTFLGPVIQSRDVGTVNFNEPPSHTNPSHHHGPASDQERDR
jgi:hypothetical protein